MRVYLCANASLLKFSKLKFLNILFLCLIISSCGETTEEFSNSIKGLTTTKLWEKTDLVLCFDSKGASNAEKYYQAIKRVVARNFTAASTVINFSGFESCQTSKDADVELVLVDKVNYGAAGIASHFARLDNEELKARREGNFPGITKPTVHISVSLHEQEESRYLEGITAEVSMG